VWLCVHSRPDRRALGTATVEERPSIFERALDQLLGVGEVGGLDRERHGGGITTSRA
jgi:hypothetical protein